jgi:hypothetical protein
LTLFPVQTHIIPDTFHPGHNFHAPKNTIGTSGKGPGDSIPALEFLASQSAKGAIGSYYGVTSLFAFFFLYNET